MNRNNNTSDSSFIEGDKTKRKVDPYLQGLLQKINNIQTTKLKQVKIGEQLPVVNIISPPQQQTVQLKYDNYPNTKNEQNLIKIEDENITQRSNDAYFNEKGVTEQTVDQNVTEELLIPQKSQIPIEYLKRVQTLIKEYNILHQNSKQEKDILALMIQKSKLQNDTVSQFLKKKYNDGKNQEQLERDYQAVYTLVELLERKIVVLDKAYMRKRSSEVQYKLIIEKQKEEIVLLRKISIEMVNMRITQLHPFQMKAENTLKPNDLFYRTLQEYQADKRSYSVDGDLYESSAAATTQLKKSLKFDQSFEEKFNSFDRNQYFVNDLEEAEGFISSILSSSQVSQSIDKRYDQREGMNKQVQEKRNAILLKQNIDQTLDELSEIQNDIKHSQNIIMQGQANNYNQNGHQNLNSFPQILQVLGQCSERLIQLRDSNQVDSSIIKSRLTDIFSVFVNNEIQPVNVKDLEEINKLQIIINQQDQKINQLQNDLNDHHAQKIEYQKQNEEQNQKLISEILSSKEEQNKLQLEEKLKEISNLSKQEFENFKFQLECTTKGEVDKLNQEIEHLKSITDNLKLENLQLLSQNTQYSLIKNQEQEQKMSEIQAERENDLRQQLEKKEKEMIDLNKQQIQQYQQQFEMERQLQIQKLQEEISNKVTIIEKQQEEIQNFEKMLKDKDEQFQQLLANNEHQNQQKSQDTIINFQRDLENKILTKEKEMNEISQKKISEIELAQQEEKIKLQTQIQNMQDIINEGKQQIKHLQKTAIDQIEVVQKLKDQEYDSKIQEILAEKDEEFQLLLQEKEQSMAKEHQQQLVQQKSQIEDQQKTELQNLQTIQNDNIRQLELKLNEKDKKYREIESQLEQLNANRLSNQLLEIQVKELQMEITKKDKAIELHQKVEKTQIQNQKEKELETSQMIESLENKNEELTFDLQQSLAEQAKKQALMEQINLLVENQVSSLQKCIDEKDANFKSLLTSKEEQTKKELTEKDEHYKKLLEDKDKQMLSQKNSELMNYQKNLLQKSEEVNKLKQQISELKSSISSYELENNKLKQEIESMKQNISSKSQETQELKTQLESLRESHKQIDSQKNVHQRQTEIHQKALVQSEKELKAQQKLVSDSKTQISALESGKLTILKQLQAEQKSNLTNQEENTNLKKNIQELKSQLSSLENQKQSLQKQLETDKKILNELLSYLAEKSNSIVETENQFMHTIVDQIHNFSSTVEERLKESQEKLKSFQQIQEKQKSESSIAIETKQLSIKIEQIQQENQSLLKKIIEFIKMVDSKKESLFIQNDQNNLQNISMKDIKSIFEKQEKIVENQVKSNKTNLKELQKIQSEISIKLLKIQNEIELQILKSHNKVLEKVEKVQKKILPGGLSDKTQYEELDESLNGIISKFENEFKALAKQASGTQWDYGKENRLLQRQVIDLCEEINKMKESQFSVKMQLRKKEMQDIDTFNQISKNLVNQINKFQTMIEGVQVVTSFSPVRSSMNVDFSNDSDQGRQSLNPFIKNGNQLNLFGSRKSQVFSSKFEKVDEKQENEENDLSEVADDDEDFKKFQESLKDDGDGDEKNKEENKDIPSLQNLSSTQLSPTKRVSSASAIAMGFENGFSSNPSIGKISPLRESLNNLDLMRQSVSRIETEDQRNVRYILDEVKKIKSNYEKVISNLLKYNFEEVQIKNLKQTIEHLETELSDYKNKFTENIQNIQRVLDELQSIGDPVIQYSQMNTTFKKCFNDVQQLYKKQLDAQDEIQQEETIDVVKQIKSLSKIVDSTMKQSISTLVV